MSEDVKTKIHQMIDTITNESVLQMVSEDITYYAQDADIIDELNDSQLEELNTAIFEADNNETLLGVVSRLRRSVRKSPDLQIKTTKNQSPPYSVTPHSSSHYYTNNPLPSLQSLPSPGYYEYNPASASSPAAKTILLHDSRVSTTETHYSAGAQALQIQTASLSSRCGFPAAVAAEAVTGLP